MKVLVVYDDPSVLIAGYDDPTVMDLVAHFLGIATHHNDNAAPLAIAALKVVSVPREKVRSGPLGTQTAITLLG
tara:strand:+ start:132 stop:353 length:222 start_codon:yes stop_codon:yes gene_type:complete